jgi:hypothetical protein
MSILKQVLDDRRKKDTVAQEIVAAIYSGYLPERPEKVRQKKSFAPSGLFYGSGACGRRWVLSFQQGIHEDKADPRQIANMQNGSLAHGRIQSAMQKAGIVTDIEREIRMEDPPIFGYADAIIQYIKEYVGEIKTTSHANFEYRRTSNKIASYHLGQILLYMYIEKIHDGIIIYESKDTNELFAITLEMTDEYLEWVEYVLDWCRDVWRLYENDIMPKRSFRVGSKVCASCPVEKRCDLAEIGTTKVDRLKLLA